MKYKEVVNCHNAVKIQQKITAHATQYLWCCERSTVVIRWHYALNNSDKTPESFLLAQIQQRHRRDTIQALAVPGDNNKGRLKLSHFFL